MPVINAGYGNPGGRSLSESPGKGKFTGRSQLPRSKLAGEQSSNAASCGGLTLAAFAKCPCQHGTWLIARGNELGQKKITDKGIFRFVLGKSLDLLFYLILLF